MRNLYYLLKMVRLSLPYKAKKYITVLLFIMLGFFLFRSAFAVYDPNPKHSKWYHDSIVNDPLTKAAVRVEAQRTYPVTVVDPATGAKDTITKAQRSVVKLTPPAAQVGKKLMKGGLGGVITQALIGLGITAVDWLLDPENNSVKYLDPDSPNGGSSNPNNKYLYAPNHDQKDTYATPNEACITGYLKFYLSLGAYPNVVIKAYIPESFGCLIDRTGNGSVIQQTIVKLENPAYDPNATESTPGSNDYIHIPIETVAEQVIRDAAGGDAPAMQVMTDTALDMLEAGLLDPSLEAAADPKEFGANQSDPLGGSSSTPDPETDPDGDTGGETPNPQPEGEPFQLPPFCSWATKVCDFIDWVKTEPTEPPDGAGDIEIEKPDPDMHVGILERLYIDMPAECPPDPVLEFMGAKIPFPMSVFCQFASMMKPLILLFAYIKGLSIIGNGLN